MELPNFRKYLLLLLISTFSGVFFNPAPVFAQAFERGYQAFLSGDYRRAKVYLSQGLRQTRDRYDRALMYKLIGISEFNLGDRKGAQSAFKKAIRLDPAVRILREESRNKSVLKLFASVKKSMGQDSRPAASRRSRNSFSRSAQRRAPRMSSSRSNSGMNLSLYSFLPFGFPQFNEGKTILGASFAAGQALGLGLLLERNMAANNADKDALDVIDAYEQGGSELDETTFLAYLDENEAFVNNARQEATIGLLIFLGSYGASVAEAIFFSDPPPSSRRRRAEVEAINSLAEGEKLDHLYLNDNTFFNRSRGFELGITRVSGNTAGLISFHKRFD